jgi:hypothetical protein
LSTKHFLAVLYEKWTFKKNIKVEIQSYKSTERQYSGPKGQKDEQ